MFIYFFFNIDLMKARNFLASIIFSLLPFTPFTGCVSQNNSQKNQTNTEFKGRGGLDVLFYDFDIDRKIQTVPFDFNRPNEGSNTTNLNSGFDVAPRLGIEVSSGTKNFRAKIGVDERLNIM